MDDGKLKTAWSGTGFVALHKSGHILPVDWLLSTGFSGLA
jgi:hypothetical protein